VSLYLDKYTSEDFHAKAQINLISNPIYNINSGSKYLNATSSYVTVHSASYS